MWILLLQNFVAIFLNWKFCHRFCGKFFKLKILPQILLQFFLKRKFCNRFCCNSFWTENFATDFVAIFLNWKFWHKLFRNILIVWSRKSLVKRGFPQQRLHTIATFPLDCSLLFHKFVLRLWKKLFPKAATPCNRGTLAVMHLETK